MTTLFGLDPYTAADGSTLGANYTSSAVGTGSLVDVNGNRARLHLGTGTGFYSHQARTIISGMSAATDCVLTAKVTTGLHGTTNEHYANFWLRGSSDWVTRTGGNEVGPENGYGFSMDPGNDFVGVQESAAHNWGGAADYQPFTFVTDGVYQVEMSALGTTMALRIWLDSGGSRPGTANATVTDATTASGKAQIHHANGDNITTDFFVDDLLITDGSGSGTATPAVMARSIAIPAPTLVYANTALPAVVARSMVMPAPVPQAAGSVSPALVARAMVMPAPAPLAAGVAAPAVVARSIALPGPTAVYDSTVQPAVIARVLALPAATGAGSRTVFPPPVTLALALPAAALIVTGKATPVALALALGLAAAVASAEGSVRLDILAETVQLFQRLSESVTLDQELE